jgi:MFS family permease
VLGQTFTSLKYPNFRLWFFGQMFSLMGSWMQNAAQGYLIYKLTNSSAYLGYVSALAGLPSWIFTLFAGVIADRLPRRKILIFVQSSMMMLAFILAALVFTDLVQPWHILVLAFLLGICNAFDAPIRQSFVLELVEDREDLTNAISLNATMFTSAVVVGPAIGGLVYDWAGPEWCFTINGISFLAVIAALAMMNLPAFVSTSVERDVWKDLKAGVVYTVEHPRIRMLIINLGITGMLLFGLITLIPAWAVDVLGGDARTNGLLLSARGLGSLAAALMLASLGRSGNRGRLLTIAGFVMPVLMFIFAWIRLLPLSMAVMVGIGWAFIAVANNSNALVQSLARDDFRGRVMGVYTLVFFGASPIGSFVAGTLAASIGEPPTVIISAVLLFIYAVFVWWFIPGFRKLE